MSLLPRWLDERFFAHRQRSTGIAGIAGACVAGGLFFWRYYGAGVLSWDLFAVIAAMVAVKLAAMAWFYTHE